MRQTKNEKINWIAEVAQAACLELSDERLAVLAESVEAELSLLADLQGSGEANWGDEAVTLDLLREDRVRESLPVEALLSSAPCRVGDFFAVPELLGGGASS